MIGSLMLYGTAIAVLITLGALAVERTFGAWKLPLRGVWITAMGASLAVPLVMAFDSDSYPEKSATPVSPHLMVGQTTVMAREAVDNAVTQTVRVVPTTLDLQISPAVDSIFAGVWMSASVGLALFYSLGYLRLKRASRRFPIRTVDGAAVGIADTMGPAVLGFFRPQILIPAWILSETPTLRSLVLAHERQHIKARDQLLLLAALMLIVLVPWNPALWLQLRRLRFAIEVDCDTRVLRSGVDPVSYGEVLLQVGRRFMQMPAVAVTLIEPPSDLERRIRFMMSDPRRYAAIFSLASVVLCTSLSVVAAQLDPPRVERETLRLPQPIASMPEKVQSLVRAKYPELFGSALSQPVLIRLLLNNDLSVAYDEVRALPLGAVYGDEEAGVLPNGGFDATQLHPQDPRFMGRFVMPGGIDGERVFVHFAVRLNSTSRSVALVEPVLRKKFPALHDDASDRDVLLIALMNEDGSVAQARQQPYPSEASTAAPDEIKLLAEVGLAADTIGARVMLPGSATAPFRPTVLYAFRKSGNPVLDANPMVQNDARSFVAAQRSLIERHFPDVATDATHRHELLWVLLDQAGDVMTTGREASDPDDLAASLDKRYPGVQGARRVTIPLGDLFGKELKDDQGEPLYATFIWFPQQRGRHLANTAQVTVDVAVYRNEEFVSSDPFTLQIGIPQMLEINAFRFQVTALDLGKKMVDLDVTMQVRVDPNGAEFAERWETVAKPMIRTELGGDAVIEQGVRSSNKPSDAVVWRLEMTPRPTSI